MRKDIKKRFVCMQIIFVFPVKCHARTLLPLSFRSLPIHLKKPRARKVDCSLICLPKCFRKKRIPERRTVPLFLPVAPFFKKTKPFMCTSSVVPNLCGGDGLADTDGALAGGEALTASNLVGLLDNLLTLGQDELDVAGVGHVRVDLFNND